MTFILIILIGAILSGIVSLFFSSEMLVGLYDVVFNSGITMQTITGVEFFGLIMPISYGVGISLIILKFLKKAFDIYVLWTDGDPDADPFLLLTNFVRAVGTALIFQWLYGLFVDIFRDITNTIIERINSNCNPTVEWVNSITSLGIVPAICGLIFIICYLILLLSFMARGVEMMVMRIGVPLACVGLLDNDKGVFRAYINQFVKAFATTIVQIMLCKIGLSLMLNYGTEHILGYRLHDCCHIYAQDTQRIPCPHRRRWTHWQYSIPDRARCFACKECLYQVGGELWTH